MAAFKKWVLVTVVVAVMFSGSECFQLEENLQNSTHVAVCVNGNLTLPWSFALSSGQTLQHIKWNFRSQQGQWKLFAIHIYGKFFSAPPFSQRAQYLGNGGLQLAHVTRKDAGDYNIEVVVHEGANSFFQGKRVSVAVEDGPRVSEEPSAVYDPQTDSFHLVLSCDTVASPDGSPGDILWQTPSGEQPSTKYEDGHFYLQLHNPVKGGDYSCTLASNATASVCLPQITVDETKARVSLLEAESSHFKVKVNSNELELTETKANISQTRTDLSQTRTDLSQTQKELSETQSRLIRTESELIEAETDLSQIRTQLAHVKAKVASTESELTETKGDLSQTTTGLSRTKTDLSQTRTDLSQTKTELFQTQSRLTKTETELTETQSRLISTESLFIETETELLQTRIELAHLKAKVTHIESDLIETKDDLSQTRTDLSQTKTNLSQTRGDLFQTATELNQTQSRLSMTETELTEAQSLIVSTESELNETKTEMSETRTELIQTESRLTRTENELAGTQSRLSQLEARFDSLQNTASQKVSFYARMSDSQNKYKPDQDLLFSEVIVNEGKGFNGSVFTAPLTGLYFFAATAGSSAKRARAAFWIVVDQNTYCYALAKDSHGSPTSSTCTVTARLRAGQRVKLRSAGTTLFYSDLTTFTGFLFHADPPPLN